MMRISILAAGALLACTLAAQTTAPPKTNLKVGDTAPNFTLPDTTGKKVSLSDFKGKTVVVAFFPAAFTGGWTKEITAYQSGIDKFKTADAQVLAISTDFGPSLGEFKKKTNAEFPMLSDHMREVSKDYGVLIPSMGIANRATFVVDGEGKIVSIEEGSAALDPTGAATACSRLKH